VRGRLIASAECDRDSQKWIPVLLLSSVLAAERPKCQRWGKRCAHLAPKRSRQANGGGQSSQNTHSGFGNEAISLPATLRTFTPTQLPADVLLIPPNMPCLFAGNRRARWNFSGRERGKGIFLEITTGTLREERPSRRRRRRTGWGGKGEPKRERQRERGGGEQRKERGGGRDERRNRPTGKKAKRSPLAPPSTAYKGEEKRAARRQPSHRAEGRTRECVKRIGSRHR